MTIRTQKKVINTTSYIKNLIVIGLSRFIALIKSNYNLIRIRFEMKTFINVTIKKAVYCYSRFLKYNLSSFSSNTQSPLH